MNIINNIKKDRYLTVSIIAARLNLHVDTIRRKIKAGEIPAINVSSGKRPYYRILEQDFNNYCISIKKIAEDY